jgi:hypothetical protein
VYNANIGVAGTPNLSVEGVEGILMAHCRFGKDSAKQVSICKKGNPVNITGKISGINSDSVSLVECEFV